MNSSQLRHLVADFADSRIAPEAYRAQRREMIDAIVAGTLSIERTAMRQLTDSAQDDDSAQTTMLRPNALQNHQQGNLLRTRRGIVTIAASALIATVLAFTFWPTDNDEAHPVAAPLAPAIVAALEQEVPRTRALVESFVARRNFGEESIANFKQQWQSLGANERTQAGDELWFAALVRSLSDEVKTQKALAGLSDGQAAQQRAQSIIAFAEFLGVVDKLPKLPNAMAVTAQQAPVSIANTEQVGEPQVADSKQADPERSKTTATAHSDPQPKPAAQSTAQVQSTLKRSASPPQASLSEIKPAHLEPALPTAKVVATRPSPVSQKAPTMTGRQWLAAQKDDNLTLQIFAVNQLDRIEELITEHPTLTVHVLATEGAAPRYRIFHGVYKNEDSARKAYVELPASITIASRGAIVKSFAAVRDDLQVTTTASTSLTSPAPAVKQVATVSKPVRVPVKSAVSKSPARRVAINTGKAFTLQLLAASSLESAQALLSAFPALPLRLYQRVGDVVPYRVTYGSFATADDARTAITNLPQGLIARTGSPLPKAFDAVGSPLAR